MARILLAADPEGLARAAVPLLRRLLEPADEVMVLNVTRPRPAPVEQLDELAACLAASGAEVFVDRIDPTGSTAETLIRAADAFRADLVALGTHGRGRFGTALQGSVSHGVVSGLDCRILIVHASATQLSPKAEPAPLRRILLAVDEAGGYGQAVEVAAEIAQRHHASITVFHARHVVRRPSHSSIESPRAADSTVGRARLELRLEGLKANGLVGVAWRGVPKAIAAVADAEDSDLIVLDSRRLADRSVLAPESTTYGLLPLTTRPVLLAERTVRQAVASMAAGRPVEALLPI